MIISPCFAQQGRRIRHRAQDQTQPSSSVASHSDRKKVPYLFSEPEEEPNYTPYEEWIKTYKPYFITTLSKETAREWIEQADKIIRMVEFNEKRMQYRSKIDVQS